MYFMKASEDPLPNDLIWLSDMPCAAAILAAPIRKLCDLNWDRNDKTVGLLVAAR